MMKSNNEFEIFDELFSFEWKEINILNKLHYDWYGQNQLKVKFFELLTQIDSIH
jgi:hypothetical protein